MPPINPLAMMMTPQTMLMQQVLEIAPYVFLLVYFAPVIAAVLKKNAQAARIFLINLFLGWTVIFWCFSLFSAFAETPEKAGRFFWKVLLKSVILLGLILLLATVFVPGGGGTPSGSSGKNGQSSAPSVEGMPVPAEELFGK